MLPVRGLVQHLAVCGRSLAPLLASCSSSSMTSSSQPSSSSTHSCSSNSRSGGSNSNSSAAAQAVFARGFRTGVVDVQQQQQQQRPRHQRAPNFNPDDGPEAYLYWENVWRRENPRKKRHIPKRQPLYLEAEQQEELCQAAVDAGVPSNLVYGDTRSHELPRLIHYMMVHRPKFGVPLAFSPGIPTTPEQLVSRIKELQQLEGQVPGLDFTRIYQTHGFGVLSVHPPHLQKRIEGLRRTLEQAGVSAEPGMLFTAAPKMAFFSSKEIARRAKRLPVLFEKGAGAAPSNLLSHPFQAKILGNSSNVLARRIYRLKKSHGKEAAGRLLHQLPQLLQMRPGTLDLKTAALADALPDKSLAAAKQLVAAEPRLLTHSSEKLQQRVQGLTEILGLGPEDLQAVLRKEPSLLHKSIVTLGAKLLHLQGAYGLSEQQAAELAKQHPRLLCFAEARLSAPLERLRQIPEDSILAPAKAQAVSLCLQEPGLIMRRVEGGEDSLAARLELLQNLAATSPAWQSKVSELVAGNGGKDLAAVLVDRSTLRRLQQVQEQQQQQQQQDVLPGILEIIQMSEEGFRERFGGAAGQESQQAGSAAAAEAE